MTIDLAFNSIISTHDRICCFESIKEKHINFDIFPVGVFVTLRIVAVAHCISQTLVKETLTSCVSMAALREDTQHWPVSHSLTSSKQVHFSSSLYNKYPFC